MRQFFLVFSLLMAPAMASDFRVLDFGQSCDGVREREEALGSASIVWNPSKPELIAFTGQEFHRDVSIVYLCPRGSLLAGNYLFPTESLDDALKSLRSIYDTFLAEYGLPWMDNTAWQHEPPDPRAIQADPRKYSVYWQLDGILTLLSVMPVDESQGAWHVVVRVHRPKPK
jgi:hypothetical protein